MRSYLSHIILLLIQILFVNILIDDAFIYFRYARNFAANGVLSYNLGEAPQEGFSSLVWVLMLSIWGNVIPLMAKIIGGVIAHITLILVNRVNSLSGLVLACIPFFGLHSVTGMDTSLYLLAITIILTTEKHQTIIYPLLLPVRIEITLLIIALLIWGNMKQQIDQTRAFALILSIVTYHALRFMYFGSLVPLPMTVKVSGLTLDGLIQVLRLWRIGPIILVALFALVKDFSSNRRLFIAGLALGVPTLLTDPIMGYALRFSIPLIIPILLIATWPPPELSLGLREQRFAILFLVVFPLVFTCEGINTMDYHNDMLANGHILLAHDLNDLHGSTIAIGDIGIIGWMTDLYVLDTVGLVTEWVADRPTNAEWMMLQRPDYIVLAFDSSGATIRTQEYAILQHEDFTLFYVELKSYQATPNYVLTLYGRNEYE